MKQSRPSVRLHGSARGVSPARLLSVLFAVLALIATLFTVHSPPAQAMETQRTVFDLDRVHNHTSYWPTNADQNNANILNQPSSYLSGTNYYKGRWYLRMEINNKPTNKQLWGQLCLWQHGSGGTPRFQKETCSPGDSQYVNFSNEGVYYVDLGTPQNWWFLGSTNINWNRKADIIRFMLKDPITKKLMYSQSCGAHCFGVNNHLPIDMEAEVIMVGAGHSLNAPCQLGQLLSQGLELVV